MEFSTGKVVKLKSGGPEMTVNGIIGDSNNPIYSQVETRLKLAGYTDGNIYCQWFDDKNKLESGCFKQEMLEKVEK